MSDNPYHNPGTPASSATPITAKASDSYPWRFIPLDTLCILATVGLTAHAGLFFCSATLDIFGEIMFPGFTDPTKPFEPGLEQAIVMTQLGILVFYSVGISLQHRDGLHVHVPSKRKRSVTWSNWS